MLELWNTADGDIDFLKTATQLSYAVELERKPRAALPRR
jgi:hypothetical protein